MLLLARRTSSHTSVVVPKTPAKAYAGSLKLLAFTSESPRFPLELFDRIIQSYIEGIQSSSGSVWLVDVVNLRLCSRAFNQLTLRYAFERVSIENTKIWDGTVCILKRETKIGEREGFKAGFACVRNLSVRHLACLLRRPDDLALFTALSFLSLTFEHAGLNTQFDCVKRIFGSTFGSTNAALVTIPSLKCLKITRIPAIDLTLLKLVVPAFPNLAALDLESTSRLNLSCCLACLQDSMTLTMHSPVSRRFCNAEELATSFGEALQPLTSLKSLHLGIFLSPEEFLENHVVHHRSNKPADVGANLATNIATCAKCENSLEVTEYQELLASLRVAQYVKSLDHISWDTCGKYPLRKDDARKVHQVEEALEGSNAVIFTKDADTGSEDFVGSPSQDPLGHGNEALDEINQGSLSLTPSSELDDSSQVSDRREGRIMSEEFKVKMKVIRENKRVRVQRVDLSTC